jgi:hypothetical protein
MIYFFVIYTLYYVVQIDGVGPLNRNGGSREKQLDIIASAWSVPGSVLASIDREREYSFSVRWRYAMEAAMLREYIAASTYSSIGIYDYQ